MNAYGRSDLPLKTQQARRWLLELIAETKSKDGMKMSVVPFTVLLNAAAHSPNWYADEYVDIFAEFRGEKDPYAIAVDTYHELREDLHELDIEPDHVVFATMLDVVKQHTDPLFVERRQKVEDIFEDACRAGQVSALVVRALKDACPTPDILRTLLNGKHFNSLQTVNSLPREWTRNVPPQARRLAYIQGKKGKRPEKAGRKES
jgi:hypothetical protein